MGATMIRESLAAGLAVQLERAGRTWQLPADTTAYRHNEVACWFLYDEIRIGDRLVVPAHPRVFLLGMFVNTRSDDRWLRQFDAGWFQLSLWLASVDECPACATVAGHCVDIPADLTEDRPYAVRSCIVCDTAWQQEDIRA